jgi:hypothetical protein
MRSIPTEVTQEHLRIAQDFPIGARVRAGGDRCLGTVRWLPLVCDAGTVSLLVQWDGFPPDRDRHYTRVTDLIRV